MLPPRYAQWLADLLPGTLPEEQAATCSRCAMQAAAVPEGYRFRADAKCCTYVPAVVNFLVGALLRDLPPGTGRTSLESRVAHGVCTPHGLDVTDDERHKYARLVEADQFGRDPDLRCPHYIHEAGGLCGIWRHRNAVCATWYCKHDRGAAGQRFWRAVEALLTLVERELSHWCACQVLFRVTPPGPAPDVGDDSDDTPEWQAWSAHAAAYYRECAALVEELTWPEVQTITGPELEPLISELRAAHAALEPSSSDPPALVPGLVRISRRGPTSTRVVTYSDSDALDLPSELVALLPRFDGRPTDVVLAEIARDGVVLTPALVARLVDFAVLAPAEP
jgi:hypothetical protein